MYWGNRPSLNTGNAARDAVGALFGVVAILCAVAVSFVPGKSVTAIQALSRDRSYSVQRAWIAKDVPRCGYR